MEVKETKTASIDDVIGILESDKSELTYEQQLALSHAKKFTLSDAKAKKIRKELDGIGNISEAAKLKILEIMPKNASTLRQILIPERKTFSDEEIGAIMALVKEKG